MGAKYSSAPCCSGNAPKCQQYWIAKDAPEPEPDAGGRAQSYPSAPPAKSGYDLDIVSSSGAASSPHGHQQQAPHKHHALARIAEEGPLRCAMEPAPIAHCTEQPTALEDGELGDDMVEAKASTGPSRFTADDLQLGDSPSVFDTLNSNMSMDSTFTVDVEALVASGVAAPMLETLTMEEAKTIVKPFIKRMVKGATIEVMVESGQLKECSMSLSRKLSYVKVRLNGRSRKILMKEVEEVIAGADVEGISTPLDDLCTTVVMSSGECITFRCADVEERDTLTMCLTIFSTCAE